MPDLGLRRMAVRMAQLPAADLEAILGRLDKVQRARTVALLAELGGRPSNDGPTLGPIDAAALPAGLSPWLLERLQPSADSAMPKGSLMTDFALGVLRTCAAELGGPPLPAATMAGLHPRLTRTRALWRTLWRRMFPA